MYQILSQFFYLFGPPSQLDETLGSLFPRVESLNLSLYDLVCVEDERWHSNVDLRAIESKDNVCFYKSLNMKN